MFDAGKHLTFYNDSYRRLWDLDRAFLDTGPDDSSVLEKLRATRKISEQPDFRAWKNKLHEAYRAVEPEKDTWYLPDGRAISIVTTPNPEGGVTYLFDDVTESLKLQRQNDGLMRVQRETLDNLAEAVAVFGGNGRAQLFNPPFRAFVETLDRGAGAASPYRNHRDMVPAALRQRRGLAGTARLNHRHRQPLVGATADGTPGRQRARLA